MSKCTKKQTFKTILMMTRRAFWGFVMMCTLSGVLWAKDGSSQSLKQTKVNLEMKRSTLVQVLDAIEGQTSFVFSYSEETVSSTKLLRVRAKDKRLDLVLKDISGQVSVAFKRIGDMIAVEKMDLEQNKEAVPVMEIIVTGKVTDEETNSPIPGVNVLVKGTRQGTVTDIDGNYRIGVPNNDDTLVFSFVGYETREVPVNNQSTIHVTLGSSAFVLEDIVAVGYGTQKKVNVTGAVDMITNEDIESRPVPNTTTALQGLLPGITIQNTSGQPGANNTNIRIRGIGTLNNPNPLVLIDGFEGDIDNLNPQDIESISVLKDAASSAIYGSRGANGVILITTKNGEKDQPVQINYNNYLGYQMPTRLPEFLGSPEYMEMQVEAERNVGRPTTFTEEEIEIARNGSDPNYYANTDWIDAIYKDRALQQNHNFSLQGGSDNFNYYMSYGLLDQEGIIVGDAFGTKRHNARIRLGTEVIDRVQLDVNIGYVDEEVREAAQDTWSRGGLIYTAHRISPLIPVRFTNGGWGYGGGSSNPVAYAYDGGDFIQNTQQLTGNFGATLDIFEDLSARIQYGTVVTNERRNQFVKRITYTYPETGEYWYADRQFNQLDVRDWTRRYQSFIAQTDYDKTFNKHNLHILLGYSQEWERNEDYSAARQNFVTDEIRALDGGTLNERNSGRAYHWAIRSGFSRVNYSFDDRYLFEANVRYDGSSRFARDVRYGWFPSFSLGWRLSEESFMEGMPAVFSDIKLRASWGKLGNQYLSDNPYDNGSLYPYVPIIENVGTMPIGAELTSAFAQTVLANPILTWESVTMSDVGLDLQLLEGQLTFSGDYFIKKTNDILLRVPLPDVIGLSEPGQNAGTVENRGWETQLSWRDRVGEFSYGLDLNFSDVKNEVTSLGGVPPTYNEYGHRQVGYPIDAFYGLVADGLAQVEDFEYDAENDDYVPLFPVLAADASYIEPGDIKYKDLDGDGEITLEGDRKVIGNPFPRYTYALRGNMNWHGIDFSFFWQGVGKADGHIRGSGRHAFIDESAFPKVEHRDRWTPENTDATYPRFTYQQGYNQRMSSFWVENAAYLRLKNVQLGYTLPQQWTQRARIQKLRVFLSADNLLTFTDFFGSYDPETPVTFGGIYPQVKTFVAGVNVSLQ